MVEKIFTLISDFWYMLFGNANLRKYEDKCISAWKECLSIEVQNKIDLQLNKFNLIQRENSGLKTIFYDRKDPACKAWPNEILFLPKVEDLKVFSGLLCGREGDVTLKVKYVIYMHNGRISSLEFESVPTLMDSVGYLEVSDNCVLYDFNNEAK